MYCHLQSLLRWHAAAWVAASLSWICLAWPTAAAAYTFKKLYSFCAQHNCSDGQVPLGALVRDGDGNLFGTTGNGGNANNAGTVFELMQGKDDTWHLKTLYSFCTQTDCTDGEFPRSSLIVDRSGNLYGTTSYGGKNDRGTIFEIIPKRRSAAKIVVLYNFCSEENCSDGSWVSSGLTYVGADQGLPYDGKAPLYGVSQTGGTHNGGLVYRLSHGPKKIFEFTAIYNFCSAANCADGDTPVADLIWDASGNLFGTTFGGGGQPSGGGTVFELSPSGNQWTEHVLYAFCAKAKCRDGNVPSAPVVMDASENLFGMAGAGSGSSCPKSDDGGCGVAYEIERQGKKWKETVIYNFCTLHDCKDGFLPLTNGLIMDSGGQMFGTTYAGGGHDIDVNAYGGGTVFQLLGDSEIKLHSFCAEQECADGEYPHAHMISDGKGNLFGTTAYGGGNFLGGGGGTIYELVP